ncbi:hypothetical protein KVF03_04195 [Helicobacter pylori]|nr:hypothetical protein KVF03_04195 [Helicobacter pylori]
MLQLNKNDDFREISTQGLWIYPEDTEVLGVACKSLLKALKPRYQKIALFSPIDGGCEGFLGALWLELYFLSASLCKQQCELEADLIESVLQTKSEIITPLAFQRSLEKKAKKQIKKVVLPESEDERILKAAYRLNAMGAVGLILLGDKEAINSQAKNLNLNLENVEIIDPNTSHYREEFANHLYELRKSKGLSEQEAKQLVLDKTYFATMLVHSGYAHAMVSGVNHS